ncbi:hypothetical protein HELRODRAFT_175152 [Helobdella robusta]|uniref:RIIa domain-containing protein n=1 Tax=Helobdella robusta TaxID=6412 RepID=T1F8X4_HELRO|nr:hypothetical protein HELRODRAFT_175152 [Helobdella robusta]ESO01122.1 hypothetical protein HELRODRAFT_175152 [Helobdella robusta]
MEGQNLSAVKNSSVMRNFPDPPHGMENYDLPGVFDELGALSETQQTQLDQYKKKMRFEDEDYLRKHPEIDCLISDLLGCILKDQPRDIRTYASNYFKDPKLVQKIEELMKKHQIDMKMSNILKNY